MRHGRDIFRAPPGRHDGNPGEIGFWALVAEGLRTNDSGLFLQGFRPPIRHRSGKGRMSIRPRLLRLALSLICKIMFKPCAWVCGIMPPWAVRVGRRVRIDHFGGMILVAEQIGPDVVIRQDTGSGIASVAAPHARPRIGDPGPYPPQVRNRA